jgi:glutamate-1-semialdehyde 2,1-aminomutase
MRDRGVFLPPSPFEAWFVSLAHGREELAITIDAARASFAAAR